MKFKILFIVFILLFYKDVNGQHFGYYYKYEFRQYLISKTENPKEYLESIKKSVQYFAIARENKIEGRMDFLLINNGNNETDVILLSKNFKMLNDDNESIIFRLLKEEVMKAIKKANKEFFKINNEKFLTEMSILFEIPDYNTFSIDERNVDLIIGGKEIKFETRTIIN